MPLRDVKPHQRSVHPLLKWIHAEKALGEANGTVKLAELAAPLQELGEGLEHQRIKAPPLLLQPYLEHGIADRKAIEEFPLVEGDGGFEIGGPAAGDQSSEGRSIGLDGRLYETDSVTVDDER